MPRISAIICTHNGAHHLEDALHSLLCQTLPPEEYEIIVVDNASCDETPQVVKSRADRSQNLRYIREERLGLSWARNTGAKVALSPYVAYLDDDAKAEPGWLQCILSAFEVVTPPPSCVGGRVWLDWRGHAPSWLPRKYWKVYSHLDWGPSPHFLAEGEYLVGANIAFRKNILMGVGGFDARLGRRGSVLLSGEEAAVLQRLRLSRLPVYYEPAASVWHSVKEGRERRRWLWNRMFWDGASQPLLDYAHRGSRRFYGVQAYLDLRRIAFFGVRGAVALVRGHAEEHTDSVLAMIQRTGRLRSNLLLALQASR